MRALLRKLLRALALRGLEAPYRRFCRPGGLEWAEMLRERGDFYSMGDHCYIEPSANITDRPYIRLGNNVRITPSESMRPLENSAVLSSRPWRSILN